MVGPAAAGWGLLLRARAVPPGADWGMCRGPSAREGQGPPVEAPGASARLLDPAFLLPLVAGRCGSSELRSLPERSAGGRPGVTRVG
ncbi:hypothetical protein NDU88_008994 [Pleurodeles waltl]|uniref:Secreted protein n=1 Tax=Pleurodeles waltl TaxID=8319 RepID=A0AAV7RWA3_PLEWA|nr:hypothetical protein NDU88_008994 [Pleurodeles waltl]